MNNKKSDIQFVGKVHEVLLDVVTNESGGVVADFHRHMSHVLVTS